MKRKTSNLGLVFIALIALTFVRAHSACAQDGVWATKAPMPLHLVGHAAAGANGIVYVVGGHEPHSTCSYLNTLLAYDPATDAWATKSPMPTGRDVPSAGVVNGVLYVVGGGTGCGSYTAVLEAYNPTTDTWASEQPMSTPRYGPGVGVVNGILYAVGGVVGSCCPPPIQTVEAYDPVTDTWTPKAPMPTQRYNFAVGVVGGILYAVGGTTGYANLATVEAYDPSTDTWSTKNPLPTPTQSLGVGTVNGVLYAMGGSVPLDSVFTANVWAYDPATDAWTAVASMPTARAGHAVATANETLYAVGGANLTSFPNAPFLAINEAFTPIDTTPPMIACPANIVIGNDAGSCSAVVNFTATATDNSGNVSVTCSPSSGSLFPKGMTTVTCTATDPSGNKSACSFTVTVNDTEKPHISCPANITLPCSGDLLVSVSFSASATDNCDPNPGVSCTPTSGSGFPVGVTMVTCTATDASGNHSDCTFTVTRAPLGFAGFLAPIGGADATGGGFASPLRTFKMNSTIPVKFTASCGGSAVQTGSHRLQAVKYSGATSAGAAIDATPQDAATAGNQFRLTTDGQWQFNLDTKGTGMSTGTWLLRATLSDGSEHGAWIQIK